MQPFKLKIGNFNLEIPAWLIIGVASIFIIGWLMTFNDITFIRISNWVKDWLREVKR